MTDRSHPVLHVPTITCALSHPQLQNWSALFRTCKQWRMAICSTGVGVCLPKSVDKRTQVRRALITAPTDLLPGALISSGAASQSLHSTLTTSRVLRRPLWPMLVARQGRQPAGAVLRKCVESCPEQPGLQLQ